MKNVKHPFEASQLIIRVSDQPKTAKISLIDCRPQEAREAKERLETHQAKRATDATATKTKSMPNAGNNTPEESLD